MGLLDGLRKKTTGEPTAEEETATVNGLANTALYTRHQSAQDAESRQDKGIDFDMINAEQAVEKLLELADYEERSLIDVPVLDVEGRQVYDDVPAIDGKGNVVYEDYPFESNGVVVPLKRPVFVKQPRIAKAVVKEVKRRLWADAALVYVDTVVPTIWMGAYEADTAKMYIRTAFHDIRKQMNHDPSMSTQQKKDCVLLLRSIRDLAIFRCEDMKEGRKPLLLKIKRESLDVHMSRGVANNGGLKK